LLPAASSQKISSDVIRVESLRCGYPEQPVLKGISFCVQAGEFIGILGPNGSGKTTLLMALTGIIPIAAGEIEILGTSIDSLRPLARARRTALVTQESEVRFPFSCREVVLMGRYPHQKGWQMDSPEDSAVVQRSLEITDTESLADRLITAISGGEKQRVLMAKALAQATPVLLLDEAVSAMDIHRKLQIFRVLRQLNEERALTVLSVLHDVNLAALFCHRLILINEGRVVADGPTECVLTSETLEAVYRTRVVVREIEGTGKRQVVFLP
jgi:iron complex transport system ATP-binding protein